MAENLPGMKFFWIAAAAAAWALYLGARWSRTPSLGAEWGIRGDNLAPAARLWCLVSSPVLALMLAWGFAHGNLPPPRSFWLVLALYPLWGFAQQFLLNAILFRNLRTLVPRAAALPLSAVLFGAAHLPDLALSGLAAVAALVSVFVFERRPNLWVLAAGHAILGTVALYALLGRDPWAGFWLSR